MTVLSFQRIVSCGLSSFGDREGAVIHDRNQGAKLTSIPSERYVGFRAKAKSCLNGRNGRALQPFVDAQSEKRQGIVPL